MSVLTFPHKGVRAGKVVDPVCEIAVNPKTAGGGRYEYERKAYFFCCVTCKEAFEKNPVKYLSTETPNPTRPPRQIGQR